MITVRNTVTGPTGNPVAGAVVRISLVVSTTGNVPGYLPTSDIIGTTTVLTDATGHWTADLTANAQITPANTYYVVNENGFTSTIVVPATGGPYDLSQVIVNPPNPSPLGIRVAVNGGQAGVRPGLNLIPGTGIALAAADNPATNTVDVTIANTGGGTGGGGVATVNHISPDINGNVQLAAADVAAVALTGAQTIAGVKTFSSAPVVPAGAFPESAVANLTTDLAGKVPTSQLGVANGVATLDTGGKLPTSQLPAIAVVSYLGAAANQAAMLALVGQQGDWCTRTDLSTNWVITGADPTQLASWTQLVYPTAPVTSVNTQTGAVSLTAANVGALAAANNLADVANSATARSNIGAAPAASPTLTGTATVNGRLITAPVTLTDAATIATDASAGNHFRCTLGGNRILGNPTNPVDGQRVIWELIQDATGSRTITLDTAFVLGTDITAVTLSTSAGKRDFVGAVYNATAARWYVIAFIRGY